MKSFQSIDQLSREIYEGLDRIYKEKEDSWDLQWDFLKGYFYRNEYISSIRNHYYSHSSLNQFQSYFREDLPNPLKRWGYRFQ